MTTLHQGFGYVKVSRLTNVDGFLLDLLFNYSWAKITENTRVNIPVFMPVNIRGKLITIIYYFTRVFSVILALYSRDSHGVLPLFSLYNNSKITIVTDSLEARPDICPSKIFNRK